MELLLGLLSYVAAGAPGQCRHACTVLQSFPIPRVLVALNPELLAEFSTMLLALSVSLYAGSGVWRATGMRLGASGSGMNSPESIGSRDCDLVT